MKILLLGTKDVREDTEQYYQEYVAFFNQAVTSSESAAEILYTLVDDLFIAAGDGQFTIKDMRNGLELKDYKAVLIRGHVHEHIDVVKAVSVYLKRNGVPVLNDYSSFRSSSKLIQAVQFEEASLPVALTVFVTPAVLEAIEYLPFGFPCIMKATNGSHGNYNYMVAGLDDIRERLRQEPGRNFILQRYVPNECDYRILLVGKEMLIIKRSAANGTHLNNTSQGGQAELIDPAALPDEILAQSQAIAQRLNLTIAGVDVLYDADTATHSFLEVNSQPQLMTGAFVKEKAKLVGRHLKAL